MASKPVILKYKEFASRVKSVREIRGLSQTAMSNLVDCALPTIQDVEASKMPLPGKSFIALYKEGVDLNWLVGGDADGSKMIRSNKPLTSGAFRTDLFQSIIREIWRTAGQDISSETAGMIAMNLYEIYANRDDLSDLPIMAKNLVDMIRTAR